MQTLFYVISVTATLLGMPKGVLLKNRWSNSVEFRVNGYVHVFWNIANFRQAPHKTHLVTDQLSNINMHIPNAGGLRSL